MKALVQTAVKDSRIGNHSYTGWNTTTHYVIEGNVYRRNVGGGVWCGREWAEALGTFDPEKWKDYNWSEQETDLDKLPADLQMVAKILIEVPKGEIVCEDIHKDRYEYVTTYVGGEMIPPTLYRQCPVLKHGQTHEYFYRYQNIPKGLYHIRNVNGQVIDEITPYQVQKDKEDKRRFFQEKLEYVMGKGFDREKAIKILKVAGPRLVELTFDWLSELTTEQLRLLSVVLTGYRNLPELGVDFYSLINTDDKDGDAWECLIEGICDRGFGRQRRCNALERIGISLPLSGVSSAGRLFAVLNIAKEILPKPTEYIGFGGIQVTKYKPVVSTGSKRRAEIPKEYSSFQPVTLGELMRRSALI